MGYLVPPSLFTIKDSPVGELMVSFISSSVAWLQSYLLLLLLRSLPHIPGLSFPLFDPSFFFNIPVS